MTRREKKARARLRAMGWGCYLGQAFLYLWPLNNTYHQRLWPANAQMSAKERCRLLEKVAKEIKA